MDGSQVTLGSIERHFWLLRSVARVMGINLTDAIAMGQLDEDGYAEMLSLCRAGGCCTICEAWLATQQTRPDRAPEHCAVARQLNRLV